LAISSSGLADARLPPKEHWITYGGDFNQRHAMDTSSVRRKGDLASFRYLVIGRKGPMKTDKGPVAYIIDEFVMDCAKRVETIARADFYDRSGKRLRSRLFPNNDWSPSTSEVSRVFRRYACDGATGKAEYESLDALLQQTFGWWANAKAMNPR
jgi:hypothetical protein